METSANVSCENLVYNSLIFSPFTFYFVLEKKKNNFTLCSCNCALIANMLVFIIISSFCFV